MIANEMAASAVRGKGESFPLSAGLFLLR